MRLRRELFSKECGSGIVDAEALCGFGTVLFCDQIECLFHARRTPFNVVRIGGQEVDFVFFEQLLREAHGRSTPTTGERGCRYLHQASTVDPFIETLRIFDDDRVALGMRDDGLYAGDQELVKDVRDLLRDGEVSEFHEEILFLVDGVFRGVLQRVVDVLKRKMKVAA